MKLGINITCLTHSLLSKIYNIDYEPTVIENRRDINIRIVPKDKTKKYEFGFIDSDDKMVDIARMFGSLNG